MSVPDPTSTQPYALERSERPAPPRAAGNSGGTQPLRFSPLSFALGVLVGVTFASCLAGVALVVVVLSA